MAPSSYLLNTHLLAHTPVVCLLCQAPRVGVVFQVYRSLAALMPTWPELPRDLQVLPPSEQEEPGVKRGLSDSRGHLLLSLMFFYLIKELFLVCVFSEGIAKQMSCHVDIS